jgi:hypothetical protein
MTVTQTELARMERSRSAADAVVLRLHHLGYLKLLDLRRAAEIADVVIYELVLELTSAKNSDSR